MAWDNGGRNLKLDQAKFIDRATLSRESAFNIAARGIRKNCNKSLVGCLKYGPKDGLYYLKLKCQHCLTVLEKEEICLKSVTQKSCPSLQPAGLP